MKISGHGQANVLRPEELMRLFEGGVHLELLRICLVLKIHVVIAYLPPALVSVRDRPLFGVCLYTGCRISEACSLITTDVFGSEGTGRPRITPRKRNTKGQRGTRSIPMNPKLGKLLRLYHPSAGP